MTEDNIRHILCEMGSQRLSIPEADGLLSLLQPDSEGRIAMEAFRKLECWQVPESGGARKRDGDTRTDGAASSG